jgi:hypothetical protein
MVQENFEVKNVNFTYLNGKQLILIALLREHEKLSDQTEIFHEIKNEIWLSAIIPKQAASPT